jgi:hypothetical protein
MGVVLVDDKTIFVKRDDGIVYVAKGVFHQVINPTGGERVFETISKSAEGIARPPVLLLLLAAGSTMTPPPSPPPTGPRIFRISTVATFNFPSDFPCKTASVPNAASPDNPRERRLPVDAQRR